MAYFANDRRHVRRDVRIPCEVVRTRDFRRIGSRTLDLSTHGMLLLGELGARLGEPVQVFFTIPGTTENVFVEGVVIRHIRGLRRTDVGRAFGIRFARLPPHTLKVLREALGHFPIELPARRQRIAARRNVAA